MIETTLFSIVKAIPAVAAIVGTRVYHSLLPEVPTLPAIRYYRTSSERLWNIDTGPMGHARVGFRFDCVAATPLAARTLADALISGLDGVVGVANGERYGAISITNDSDVWSEESELYRVVVDVVVPYNY